MQLIGTIPQLADNKMQKRKVPQLQRRYIMKESVYKSYDELPLFLNAETVARTLGISPSSGYELMHQKDFPALRIGNRIVVPKERFIQWVERSTSGGGDS